MTELSTEQLRALAEESLENAAFPSPFEVARLTPEGTNETTWGPLVHEVHLQRRATLERVSTQALISAEITAIRDEALRVLEIPLISFNLPSIRLRANDLTNRLAAIQALWSKEQKGQFEAELETMFLELALRIDEVDEQTVIFEQEKRQDSNIPKPKPSRTSTGRRRHRGTKKRRKTRFR